MITNQCYVFWFLCPDRCVSRKDIDDLLLGKKRLDGLARNGLHEYFFVGSISQDCAILAAEGVGSEYAAALSFDPLHFSFFFSFSFVFSNLKKRNRFFFRHHFFFFISKIGKEKKRKMFVDVDDSSDNSNNNSTNSGGSTMDCGMFTGSFDFSKRRAPASNSKVEDAGEDDDDEDPLDAFMAQINAELKTNTSEPQQKKLRIEEYERDAEEEEELVALMKIQEEARRKHKESGDAYDDDEDDSDDNDGESTAKLYLYDSDDEESVSALAAKKRKAVEPLAPLDHSQVSYAPFEKNFYYECPAVEKLTDEEVSAIREKHGIRVFGNDPMNPVTSFDQIDLGRRLAPAKRVLQAQGFASPTPIQMQAIPAGLNGRDIVGIAKTGSGKTLAYVVSMLAHVVPQQKLHKGDGPIAVVLVPTRELAQQVYLEIKKYASPLGLK